MVIPAVTSLRRMQKSTSSTWPIYALADPRRDARGGLAYTSSTFKLVVNARSRQGTITTYEVPSAEVRENERITIVLVHGLTGTAAKHAAMSGSNETGRSPSRLCFSSVARGSDLAEHQTKRTLFTTLRNGLLPQGTKIDGYLAPNRQT